MTPERWHKLHELFLAARDLAPDARREFLDSACHDASELRAQVESLLDQNVDGIFEEQSHAPEAIPGPALPADDRGRHGQSDPYEKTIAHYELLDELGAGGMGVVYRARDKHLNRFVALKLLPSRASSDPERRNRFIQEARAASTLNHPSIVTVHDVARWNDIDYIVMECVEGQTLDQCIPAGGLPVELALRYACKIVEAVAVAHDAGVLHRDLKPRNVMVTPSGSIKILDFGLAKVFGAGSGGTEMTTLTRAQTQSGVVMGTPGYMSPEQRAGAVIDARSDVFTAGLILYEMFTGRAASSDPDALSGDSPVRQHRPDVPAAVDHVVKKAVAQARTDRFQTAQELHAQLESLLSQSRSGRLVGLLHECKRAWKLLSRRKKIYALVTALAIGLSAGTLAPRLLEMGAAGESSPSRLPAEKHIAVLPFALIGAEAKSPSEHAFVDGLAETLTSKLTELESSQGSLWVVPFSEVRARDVASVGEVHRTFGVTLAITGSFQSIGDDARLTLNLVDARSLRQIASTVVDPDPEGRTNLQDRAAIRLARMLEVELDPATIAAVDIADSGGTAAQRLYLEARGFLQRHDDVVNVEEAIALLRQALEADPRFAAAQASLGESYWRLYEQSKTPIYIEIAQEAALRAVELDPGSADALVTLGLIQWGTGLHEESRATFLRAIDIDERNASAYRGLAAVYEALGALDDAENTYRRAIELRPDYWEPHNRLGVYYWTHGRYEDAISAFKRVMTLTPNNYRGYNNVGGILYYLERSDEAQVMFERSIEVEPNYQAYSNLGTLYFAQQRYLDAADVYAKALQIDDSDYLVVSNLANAYFWAGDEAQARIHRDHARKMVEERLAINPRQPSLLASLAVIYAESNRAEESKPLIEQALGLAPEDTEVLIAAAEVYVSLNETSAAIDWITEALEHGYPRAEIEQNPTFAEILHRVPAEEALNPEP